MQHILLIEDSKEFQTLVRQALGTRNIRITSAYSAAEALIALSKEQFDLILLDIMLPDRDGFELCSEFQRTGLTVDAPVIFLTGKEDVSNKVTAFSLGAEDYIVKPFHPLELIARIEARLDSRKKRSAEGDSVRKGGLHIEPGFQKVSIVETSGEKDLNLTPLEFKLLYYLVKHENRVFSREQLLTAVWGGNIHVFDRTVDTHVCALRKKLGGLGKSVESVPGVGYRYCSKFSEKAA